MVRFTIVKIVDENNFTPEEARYAALNSPADILESTIQEMLVALPSLAKDASKWVKKLFNAAEQEPPQKEALPPPKKQPNYQADSGTFNFSDFSFVGWYCPCCGYGKDTAVDTRFFRCGRCQEYICGARIQRLADGRQSFACHDRCGNQGFMGTGSMTSLSGAGFSTHKPTLIDDKTQRPKLPLPRRALPPSKKDKD
ncbi:MAG: hypothetical protein ABI947_11970 [Chloroflexota bacterium]